MDRRGPLAGSYPAAVALVVCALVPFLALAASLGPLTKLIASDLHLSRGALELTMGMSVAGYAVEPSSPSSSRSTCASGGCCCCT